MEKTDSTKKQDKPQKVQQKPGKAEAPKPGVPKEPKPPKQPKPPKEKPVENKVVFSGTIDGTCEKTIRIDVFDGDQRTLGGPRPKVVANKRLVDTKEFSISIPQKSIPLWIGAYCDVDGDGRPGPKDPSGWYDQNPLKSDKDRKEITIPLEIPKEEEVPQE